MRHAPASRRPDRSILALRAGVAAAFVALAAGVATPQAAADTLTAKRTEVARVQQQQEDAQADVTASKGRVQSATDRLVSSQSELESARAELSAVQGELGRARGVDRQLAADLREAKAELAAAKVEVARGEDELEDQLELMGELVRRSYQQQTPLQGLSVVFGSESTAELSQRLQWNTTIFDSTSADKGRLDAILAKLEAARDRTARIERQVAADKAAAAEQVVVISGLAAQVAVQEEAVAELVDANARHRSAAQSELAADEQAYRTLEREEVELEREIKAEIARIKAEEARRKAAAEAKARAAEAKARAAEAKARAAAAAAKRPYVPPKPTGSSSGSAPKAESSRGFIRPINASSGSQFGMRFHPILHYWRMHNGTDFGARTGTPLYAARGGRILKAGRNGGYGNFVLIGHGEVISSKYVTTGYAHMSRIVVSPGESVRQGEIIGYVGSTGLSTTPHLHLELRLDGVPTNPLRYIP